MPPQTRPSRPRPSAPSAASTGRAASTRKPGGGRQHTHPQLDTNSSSYPRTDPFGALNALRSLLSLLPSRLGSCHLKLAPAEHTLALHLLAVVEPFVGLAPCESRRVLVRQPTEVLDAIAFHVESARDLRALALTCRRLHAVVVPRHAEYRVVRAKASQLALWHHLAVHRALARNVRRLEILDERAPAGDVVVPPGIAATDTDMESTDDELGMHAKQERFLVSALRQMSALTAFRWSCSHSLVAFERVWPVLVRCAPGLREVEVNDNLMFQALEVAEEETTGQSRKQRQVVVCARSRRTCDILFKGSSCVTSFTTSPRSVCMARRARSVCRRTPTCRVSRRCCTTARTLRYLLPSFSLETLYSHPY